MNKRSFQLLIFFCFVSFLLSGQTSVVDSLKSLLPTMEKDTNMVIMLGDIAYYTYQMNPDESLEYAEKTIALAQEIGFERGMINGYYKKAIAFFSKGEYDQAVEMVTKALNLAEELHYKEEFQSSLNLLGLLYQMKGDLTNALKCNHQALDMAKKRKDTLNTGYIYNAIGNLYLNSLDVENANKYFLEALNVFEPLGMKSEMTAIYTNLGGTEADSVKALAYCLRAIELATKLDLRNHLSYAYTNLGNYYWEIINAPRKGLNYYLKGLDYANQTEDYYQKTRINIDVGSLYLELGSVDSAFYYLEAGLALAEEQGVENQIREASDVLSSCYAQKKNYKEAYLAARKGQELADTIYNKNLADAVKDADIRYETAQKEAQLKAQELALAEQQNRQSQIIIGALSSLTIAIGFFQYFFYRQKRKKQAAELALQAEQQEADRLREVDQLKSTFFTNISHELRTPLTLVAAPLEDALENVKPGLLKNHLQLAQSNTQKLLGLVNEILDLSKLEAGKVTPQSSDIAIISFCRRVFYSFESMAQLREIDFVFTSSIPESIQLHSDKEKLEKILNNLLSNALKFTPSKGKVSMHLSQLEEQLHIVVSDTGSGIAATELPRIFDRFYQSTSPEAPLQGGSGIGLALAKELAQLLGGDLQVESTLGQGSSFTLELNQSEARGEVATNSVPDSIAVPTNSYAPLLLRGEKSKLLIVEDNLEMSQYLVQSLGQQYHCTTAPDGKAALEKLQEQNFDLITSDIMMPNMDGFAFREKVNENPAWRQIPFVMLTARILEADKLRGFQLGVDDYLTKPFSRKELEARIHNLLVNKMARDTFVEAAEEEVETPVLSVAEQLLKEAEAYVLKRMDDPKLRVEDLAKELNYSSRQLARVFRKHCGLTPVNFILELRLQKARQLLESQGFQTVAEVRYEIGIESASYFTTKFTERYGKNPKDYLT